MTEDALIYLAERLGLDHSVRGDEVDVACPFAPWNHKRGTDGRPSMGWHVGVGPTKYKCFGCDEGGKSLSSMLKRLRYLGADIEDFEEILSDVEGEEAQDIRVLKTWEETSKKKRVIVSMFSGPPPSVEVYPEEKLSAHFEMGKSCKYMIRRGISIESAKTWQMGIDQKNNRAIIPIRWRTGELVGATGRYIGTAPAGTTSHWHYWNPKKNLILFGEHLLQPGKPVVVCESPLDAIKLRQYGYEGVATFGASLSEWQISKLIQWGEPVIMFYDDDEAGHRASEKAIRELSTRGTKCASVRYEGGDIGDCTEEDLNEILGSYYSESIHILDRTYGI